MRPPTAERAIADEAKAVHPSGLRYDLRMKIAAKLYEEALHLDETERAALALKLLDSVSQPDTLDEAAWIAEIERRARRALSSEEPGSDLDEALDRIERDLGL
ncbi:MAG: hypothetical protein EXR72_10155 [Myxococcales bacterium]|nr:hypothetical protein [Myxococcales bacterium]